MVASSVSDPGGLGRAVRNLAGHMADECDGITLVGPGAPAGGSPVNSLGPTTSGMPPLVSSHPRLRCHTYPARPEWAFLVAGAPALESAIDEACKKHPVVAVHVHGIWTHSSRIAIQHAQKRKLRVVISPHGMLQPAATQHHSLRKSIAWWASVRRLMAAADVIHAASPLEAEALTRVLPKARVVIAAHPLDYALAYPPRPLPCRGDRRAVYMGRLDQGKGVEMLVEAWADAAPEGWSLTLAGPRSPGEETGMSRLIGATRPATSVTLAAPVSPDRALDFITTHDLLIHPSRSENFGLAVAESLCLGVPVIATTGTPWSQLPVRGAGWCVEPALGPLTGAIRDATGRPHDKLHIMGSAGRQWMESSCTWSDLRNIYIEDIYAD